MRLTKKDYCGYDIKNRKSNTDYTCEEIFDVVQKLGKLEDLEEELGCPLEVREQALQRLDAIDNSKPSEAWRELNIIRHLEIGFDKNGKPITLNDIDGLNTIKQALLKSQQQEELLKSGDLSDGYHTFNQLYYQRCILFASLVRLNKNKSWKSFKHSDGKYCFDKDGEWFIVGIDTPIGSYTYHYENKYWDLFECQELECGKEWDGHTEEDVTRLLSLPNELEEENKFLSNTITTVNKQYTSLMSNYQEQKRVLEIIKEKGIDIGWLEQCETVEKYNYHCEANQLTQEEYELLKRCFK